MTRRAQRTDDAGASLILVLLIVTVIAAVIGVVLTESGTSLGATLSLRDQAGAAYNADAAAQIAINDLRTGYGYTGQTTPVFNNAANTSCFGPSATEGTLTLPNFYPSTGGKTGSSMSSAAVVCAGEAGTGSQGSLVPINDLNKPGNAVLTLGTNPNEDGIRVKALAKNSKNGGDIPFSVHGSIISDSNINVTAGTMVGDAGVRAHTGCSGTIISTPPPVCNSATAPDPNYAAATGTVPTYRTVPTSCPGKLVTFLPGYYDDASALSSLMSGVGPCKDSVWWFTKGTYYFDFHNTENPLLSSSGGDLWVIKNGSLVAGTPCAKRLFPDPIADPNNPQCTVVAQPPVPATMPGSCQYPTETTNVGTGVQFMFGGDSRLQMQTGGNAEMCGNYLSSGVSPVIYGVKSGSESNVSQTGLTVTTATSAGSFIPAAPLATVATNLQVTGDSPKIETFTAGKNNDSTTVTVSGFTPATIPAGSILKSAVVQVVHKQNDASKADSLVAKVTPTGGAALTSASAGLAASNSYATTSLPVDTSATGSLAQQVHNGTFTGASIDLTATLTSKTDIENVDSVKLDLVYVPPAFRAENTTSIAGNCLANTYTGVGSSACAVLSTTTSYAGALYVEGMMYTPISVVDVTLSSATSQFLRFGVVSRALFLTTTGSLSYTGPLIYLPDNSPGYGVGGSIVDLQVYVCPGQSTCSSSGHLQLTARVLVYDPNPPVVDHREMTILSWSMQR
jgi:hypothetical protein